MSAWMLYVTLVALLLSLGAWMAERATRLNRGGSRWIWVVAIAASLSMPVMVESLLSWMPDVVRPRIEQEQTLLRQAVVQTMSPASWVATSAETPATRDIAALLRALWAGASAALLLLLVGGRLHLARRARRWSPRTVGGVPVLVSDDVGPAVVGFLHPRIVIPGWVLRAPQAQQDAILAHEQSHLEARDPQLFSLAFALLVFMPWNLPLWWQLQRLRRAIEVDCDARVLAGGIDATSYGETLLAVGEHRSSPLVALAATSGSRSFLEQRLRIMLSKPFKWRRTATAALLATSLCLAALAAQVELPASTLDRYVGDYTQGGTVFYTVTRTGNRLLADSTAGPKLVLVPRGDGRFSLQDDPDAEMIFADDGSGKSPSAVLRQMGKDLPITRVDAAAVAKYKAELQARLRSQAPAPGTEAMLRRLLTSLDAGNPDYSSMQPLLAEAVRRDLPKFIAAGKQMGPIQSIEFAGVDGGGWDVFEVRRTHARLRDHIMLGDDGTIVGYFSIQP